MQVSLVLCQRTDSRYAEFRNRHYISNKGCHGQQLHYLVYVDSIHLGIISGASATYAVKPRDQFFGITDKVNLNSIVNNVVFRLENAPPNAASKVLSQWRKQIAKDWEYLYQVPVAGFETFVIEGNQDESGKVCTDRTRTGSLYKADNWTCVGLTQGSTKVHNNGMNNKHVRKEVTPKLIFCKSVKGVPLAQTYTPTWRDKEASRLLSQRRKQLLSI